MALILTERGKHPMRGRKLRRRQQNLNWLMYFVIFLGCGLVTITVSIAVGVFIFRDNIFGAGLQLAGFEAEGRTETILSDVAPVATVPQVVAPAPAQQVVIRSGANASTIDTSGTGVEVVTGTDPEGAQIATISATESELLALCQQWAELCSPQGSNQGSYIVRNMRPDLRAGAMVLYGEVQAPGLSVWQQLGIVMQTDTSGERLVVRGIDIGGMLFSTPPGELTELVTMVENTVNSTVRQLAVDANGNQYNLQQIVMDDNSLTLVLR